MVGIDGARVGLVLGVRAVTLPTGPLEALSFIAPPVEGGRAERPGIDVE